MDIAQLTQRLEMYGEVKVRYIPKTARWEASIKDKRFTVNGYPESSVRKALQRLMDTIDKSHIELNELRCA